MSTPLGGPVPGAPTPPEPPTPPAPGAPAAPTTPPTPGQDPNAPVDVSTLPPNVQKLITELRTEAGKHRTGKTAAETSAAQAQDQLGKVLAALGLNADGTPAGDPAKAAAELAGRAQQAEDAAWVARAELQVHNLAGANGADAVALLNWMPFRQAIDGIDVDSDDPGSPEFRAELEKLIKDTVAKYPQVKASAGQGPARMGAEHTGGVGGRQRAASLSAAIDAAYHGGK